MEKINFYGSNTFNDSSITGPVININRPGLTDRDIFERIKAELSDIKTKQPEDTANYREASSLEEQAKKCSKEEDKKKFLPLLCNFANKFGYPVLSKLAAEYLLGKMQ